MSHPVALVIPMANEGPDFQPFITELKKNLTRIGGRRRPTWLSTRFSKDNTLKLLPGILTP